MRMKTKTMVSRVTITIDAETLSKLKTMDNMRSIETGKFDNKSQIIREALKEYYPKFTAKTQQNLEMQEDGER